MSNRVHQLIAEIEGKTISLKQKLSEERSKNSLLSDNIGELNKTILDKDQELAALKNEIVRLESELSEKGNISIAAPVVQGVSNEQIDELVNEIEYCIAQLKK